MKLLLRLRSWQIFLLIMLPLLFSASPAFGAIMEIIGFAAYFAWIYTIGTAAFTKMPEGHKIRMAPYKRSFFFVVLYLTFFLTFFGSGYISDQYAFKEPPLIFMLILMPLHLYAMWCILYIFAFTAKVLVSVMEGRIVNFDKSFRFFLALWVFPIGVWYVQPEARKLTT